MQRLWYRFIRWLTRIAYYQTHGGLRSIGEEHIPAEGPVILAPNHVSYLDPPAIACALRRHIQPMAKEELFKGPLGWMLNSLGAFPVKRGEGDTEAIRKAIAVLEGGGIVLVFPEGTRGDGVTMGPFNRGVAMLARRTNATVVPIGVTGTNIVMPKGGKGRKHPMTVAFGPGFRYGDLPNAKAEFAPELERRILALCHAHGLPLRSASSIEGSSASVARETRSAAQDSAGA